MEETIKKICEWNKVYFSDKNEIPFEMDKEIKEQSDKIFAELGISMTAAINMFLRATIRENGIPFSLKLDVPNKETQEALSEFEEMKNNKDKYKRYDSFKDILEEI